MECIKLITSSNYMDKRIGYLGLTLLLTDQEEVLMLVTNSLKARFLSTDCFVVSGAVAMWFRVAGCCLVDWWSVVAYKVL